MFGLEILFLAVPIVLLFRRRIHTDCTWLYFCAVLTLLGFVTNRMNALAIIASGFLVFALAVGVPELPKLVREAAGLRRLWARISGSLSLKLLVVLVSSMAIVFGVL